MVFVLGPRGPDMEALCNGFKICGLNADADRVAVQSSFQSTWLLGRGARHDRRSGRWVKRWQEVAILRDEIIVLRPYGGAPELEIVPLGGACGALIVEATRGATRIVRVGQHYPFALDRDEAAVVKTERVTYPLHPGVGPGAYGPGVQI